MLAASKHIKICVSSRPWPAFLSEWDDSNNTLKVQDFTKGDMDKYIHDILVEDSRFASLAHADAQYFHLIPTVSERAQGVWLWVFLVVRDLLRDMRDQEPYSQLLVRLNSYPQELERYFEDLMDRIDKIYHVESAHIFLLILSSHIPLSILALTQLQSWDDPSFALRAPIKPADTFEIEAVHKNWVKRLQRRCRDLLRITCEPEVKETVLRYQVSFLHRTVREFLTDEHQSKLLQRAQKGFDAKAYLSRVTLLLIKQLGYNHTALAHEANRVLAVMSWGEPSGSVGPMSLVMEILHHAWHIEQYPSNEYAAAGQVALLDGLGRTVRFMAQSSRSTRGGNSQASWEHVHVPELLYRAVEFDLHLYIRCKLEEDPRRILTK